MARQTKVVEERERERKSEFVACLLAPLAHPPTDDRDDGSGGCSGSGVRGCVSMWPTASVTASLALPLAHSLSVCAFLIMLLVHKMRRNWMLCVGAKKKKKKRLIRCFILSLSHALMHVCDGGGGGGGEGEEGRRGKMRTKQFDFSRSHISHLSLALDAVNAKGRRKKQDGGEKSGMKGDVERERERCNGCKEASSLRETSAQNKSTVHAIIISRQNTHSSLLSWH